MTILNRNNLNIGIGLGILLPIIISLLLIGIITVTEFPLKIRTTALVGICCNILLLRAFQRRRANQSIRGLVLATVVIALVWLGWFYDEIMTELGK